MFTPQGVLWKKPFISGPKSLVSIEIFSLSQEESRNISENVRWGQRKRFADGKVSLPYGQFLGYEKGEDGLPKIVEKQAELVREIYDMFLEGKTPSKIAECLTKKGYPTPGGKVKWTHGTVKSILTNEKYRGDAILQKCYTVDFLSKKRRKNNGELPQYYVENSHEAIVTPEIFEMVQEEFRRRKSAGKRTSSINCFASRIVCKECGGFFGRKVWHSGSKYEQRVWHCNNKFTKRTFCSTPHLKEESIKKAFVGAFNELLTHKEELIENYSEKVEKIMDFSKLKKEQEKVIARYDLVESKIKKLISENAKATIDCDEYDRKYNKLAKEYRELKEKNNEIKLEMTKARARKDKINAFIEELKKQKDLIEEFDERIWSYTLDTLIVKSKDEAVFKFKDETEISWRLE